MQRTLKREFKELEVVEREAIAVNCETTSHEIVPNLPRRIKIVRNGFHFYKNTGQTLGPVENKRWREVCGCVVGQCPKASADPHREPVQVSRVEMNPRGSIRGQARKDDAKAKRSTGISWDHHQRRPAERQWKSGARHWRNQGRRRDSESVDVLTEDSQTRERDKWVNGFKKPSPEAGPSGEYVVRTCRSIEPEPMPLIGA